jgi:uncharacterized membrane protein YphA (DoxX/SURF4 family)
MKVRSNIRNVVVEVICLLYILLFVYAAVNKLLDFENFSVQLGQSPILGSYSEFIVWLVPLSEIIVAVLLSFSKLRRIGLLFSYTLMVMFTTYIYIILNYSSFVPCSCGGVLEKMSWSQHLIFNVVFIILALVGIYLTDPKRVFPTIALRLTGLTIFSLVAVIGLFRISENKIHFNNAFTRRIPHSPVKMLKGISVEHNSFYIAGYDRGKIYLGNSSAPKYIMRIDSSLTGQIAYRLNQDNNNFSFATAQVRIKDGYYYFADGTIPVIYRGSIKDWKGKPVYNGKTTFTAYEVIDTASFIVKAIRPKTGENFLAFIDVNQNSKHVAYKDILQKRIDGVFDTDGLLSYNPILKTALYTYYYRNQYLVATKTLDSIVRGKTIDTLRQVDLKFAYLHTRREKKFATNPEKINTYATTSRNYLYIKSKRLGKYDRPQMLKDATIIDVYQLNNNSYKFSFYFYNYKGEEIKSFKVYDDIIVGLTKQYLVVGRFRKERFNPLE